MRLLILENMVCEKPDRVRGSGYLSGRYDMNRSTPLNPWNRVSTNRMKLTWQSMRSQWILTLIMHDVGSRACIKNEQNMSGCVPGPPVTNALSWNRISEWWIDKIMRMSRNKINQTSMVNKLINQSVSHKITYVGPPPKPDWSCVN